MSVSMKGSGGRSIHELVDTVPWGRLADAYDFALDAPAMLHAQVGAADLDPDFDVWIFSSIVHQGTPNSATAPTLWLMRRIIEAGTDHPAIGICLNAIAECADAVARAQSRQDVGARHDDAPDTLWYRSPAGDPLWASVLPPDYTTPPMVDGRVDDDCFPAAAADLGTLTACVFDWPPTIAECIQQRRHLDDAMNAASAIVNLSPTGPLTAALDDLVDDDSVPQHQRAAALHGLSRAGIDISTFTGRTERALRFAAALGQPDQPGHLATLVEALGDLEWLSASFPVGLPGAEPWLLSAVVMAVLDQTPASEADPPLVEALVGVMRRPSGPLGATWEWGPVLRWAFPDRVQHGTVRKVPLPTSLTPLQGRLLDALVHNDDVWTPGSGNDSLALGQVGLPHDRAAVERLFQPATPPQTTHRWPRRTRR